MSLPIIDIKEAVASEINYIKNRSQGNIKSLQTPWRSWNRVYMNGLEPGGIYTIAGMSGSGKTTVLSMIESGVFTHNPTTDIEVLSFNFEMLARKIVGRKIAGMVGLTTKELYTAEIDLNGNPIPMNPDIKKAILKAANEIQSNNKISYVEFPGTTSAVKDTIVKFIDKKDIIGRNAYLLVTLDHAVLLKKSAGKDERNTVVDLMTTINELKKAYPFVTFIILSQLNRNIEDIDRRSSLSSKLNLHYPTKGDIFASDALYTFSDGVCIIHRPELLGISQYGPKKWKTNNITYCHHLKNRDGIPCITAFSNNLKNFTFNDFSLTNNVI